MSLSVTFAGSVTPTQNVQHVLGTIAAGGVFIFNVDLGPMRNGDEVELRIMDKLTSGTVACVYQQSYAHQQATQLKKSPPFDLGSGGGMVSLRQVTGTMRNFPFEVRGI
jgi:hypothetical protein